MAEQESTTTQSSASSTETTNTQQNRQSGNGDIIGAMQAEQDKLGAIVALLEKGGTGSVFQSIVDQQKAYANLMREQLNVTTRIYNLMVLWSRAGGISDQTRRGMTLMGDPNANGNSEIREAVHDISRSVQEQTRQVTEATREMMKIRERLDSDLQDSERRMENILDRQRQVHSLNETQFANTQDKWDRSIEDWKSALDAQQASFQGAGIGDTLDSFLDTLPEKAQQRIQEEGKLNEDLFSQLKAKAIQEVESFDASLSDEDPRKIKDAAGYDSAIDSMFGDLVADAIGSEIPKDLLTDQEHLLNSTMSIMEGIGGGSATSTMKGIGQAGGAIAGELVGDVAGDALGAALVPVLGPLAPVVGQVGGEIVGEVVDKTIVAGFEAIGEQLDYIMTMSTKMRDKVVEAGIEKIRQDVKTMGAYQVEVYQEATQQIYSAWDKNLAQVTATQGYTKEALNSLQDSVAQNLQELGYANAINAADFTDVLVGALNANLSGELANVFATQSMILQKAVPEFNAQSMAEQFAAIWARANHEGANGEEEMTESMNQIAGAIKAIEQTTEGNNQFIKQVPAYLTQAQEMVARAGGSVDKVAGLTTQMMAAEGPLAALTPQLSGFTGELVNILVDQNNSTAVALRSIMHDMDDSIGILATDFMKSFMEDSQNTLEVAYRAIDEFINKNSNPAAEQEFYVAMQDLFGISAEKLAQVDFAYIADQLAQTNAGINSQALVDAQNLVKDGETATFEEQLVNNTANMLLATNAVADTLDNAIMRELEKHELALERLVYESVATQSVDLAEQTLGFFRKIGEVFMTILDPLGLVRGMFDMVNSSISALYSLEENVEMYQKVATASSVGNRDVAQNYTHANTVGGVTAVITAAESTRGNAFAVQQAMEKSGVSGSFEGMLDARATTAAQASSMNSELPSSIDLSAASGAMSEEERAKREADEKAWQEASSSTQSAVKEKEIEKQAAASAQDEAIMRIDTNVGLFEGYFVTIDDNVQSVYTSTTNMEALLTDWGPAYFDPALLSMSTMEETQLAISGRLDSMFIYMTNYNSILNKWWEKDEPFIANLEGWVKNLNESLTVIQYKLHSDYYKQAGANLDTLVTGVSQVNTNVLTIKSALDSSFGTTGSSLTSVVSNQTTMRQTVQQKTDEIKTEVVSVRSSVQSVQAELKDFHNQYGTLQNTALQSLANIGLATNKTVAELELVDAHLREEMAIVQSKQDDIRKQIVQWDEHHSSRLSSFIKEQWSPLATDVSEILSQLRDSSKNIIYGYLRDTIYPAIAAIRSGAGGNDLNSVIDRLNDIINSLGYNSTLVNAVGEVRDAVNNKSIPQPIDYNGKLDSIERAIGDIEINVTNAVENA